MWQYRIDDRSEDEDPETFARNLAAEGWEFAARTGARVQVNGVTLRRYYLRRAVPSKGSPTVLPKENPDARGQGDVDEVDE